MYVVPVDDPGAVSSNPPGPVTCREKSAGTFEPVPLLLLTKAICHCPFALCSIEMLIESPALIGSGTGREDWGSVSTQASYSVRPWPRTVSWVPA